MDCHHLLTTNLYGMKMIINKFNNSLYKKTAFTYILQIIIKAVL